MKEVSFEFLTNNVDPTNQVKFPFYLDGVDKEEASFKVMFIGNSITYHERKEDIGWNKDCGMAASSLENDYVHVIIKYLESIYGNKVSACILNGGNWENDYTNDNKFISIKDTLESYKPDLTILRIGENFSKENLKNNIDPTPSFIKLIKESQKHSKEVLITSLFWHQYVLDAAIKKAAEECKVDYIEIADLGDDDSNKAIGQYQHQGICGHPSDLGMKRIAERIIKHIKTFKY